MEASRVEAHRRRLVLQIDGPWNVTIGPAFRARKPNQHPAFLQPGGIDHLADSVAFDSGVGPAGEVSRPAEAIIGQVRKETDSPALAVKQSRRAQLRLHDRERRFLPLLIGGLLRRRNGRRSIVFLGRAFFCAATDQQNECDHVAATHKSTCDLAFL